MHARVYNNNVRGMAMAMAMVVVVEHIFINKVRVKLHHPTES